MGLVRIMTIKEKKKIYWQKWYSKNKQLRKNKRMLLFHLGYS
jgi:hypothetical protein